MNSPGSFTEENNVDPSIPNQLRWIVRFFILIGFGLGLFSTWLRYFIYTDGAVYATLGKNLAEGVGLKYCGGTYLYFPPGYPLVISVFYLILRDAELSSHLVSFVAYLVSILITSRLAWSIRPSILFTALATAIATLHPYFVLFSGSVMSESLFVSVVLAAALCTWKIANRREDSIGWWLVWGALGGFAYLIRADGIMYWPLQVLFIAIFRWKEYRLVMGKLLLSTAIFIGVLLPYLILIKNVTGKWQMSTKTAILIDFSNMKMDASGRQDETRYTSKLSDDGKTFAINNTNLSLGSYLIDHSTEAIGRIAFNIKKLIKQTDISFSWTNLPVLIVLLLTCKRRIVSKKSLFILIHLLPIFMFLLMYPDPRFLLAFTPFTGLGFARAGEEVYLRIRPFANKRTFPAFIFLTIAGAILAGAIFGDKVIKISKRVFEFDVPLEHKEMGLWMKDNLDITPTTRITHRNPWVSYYAGGCHKRTPFFQNADTDRLRVEKLAAWCREMGVSYLIVDERMTKRMMPELAFLLAENETYPELILKHVVAGKYPKIVLYAIQPVS